MKKQRKNSDILIIVIAAFLVGVVAGAFLIPGRIGTTTYTPVALSGESQVVMGIPAVDTAGKGVLGKLTTEVRPGDGKVLVNVINLITLSDTQESAQKAARAAANLTKTDMRNVDVLFNIDVNASSIEGPSAGASMAVSIVLGLRNETPRSNVMMTGTIEEGGHIGAVGAVLEKAMAAKEGGATVFVVPKGQAVETQTTRTRQCRQVGSTEYCKIIYQPNPVSISQKLNMTVVEADTLEEAVKYFEK